MIYGNYKNGEKVVVKYSGAKAKVTTYDPLSSLVGLELTEEYIDPVTGKKLPIGFKTQLLENYIARYYIN